MKIAVSRWLIKTKGMCCSHTCHSTMADRFWAARLPLSGTCLPHSSALPMSEDFYGSILFPSAGFLSGTLEHSEWKETFSVLLKWDSLGGSQGTITLWLNSPQEYSGAGLSILLKSGAKLSLEDKGSRLATRYCSYKLWRERQLEWNA